MLQVVRKANAPGFTGPAAAQPGTSPGTIISGFFSEQNWGVQAVSLLNPSGDGVPTTPLLVIGLWILIVLRFTIFYGFFGTE